MAINPLIHQIIGPPFLCQLSQGNQYSNTDLWDAHYERQFNVMACTAGRRENLRALCRLNTFHVYVEKECLRLSKVILQPYAVLQIPSNST